MSEFTQRIVADASRLLTEIDILTLPVIGQPAPDGLYLQGVDPHTGMPDRPQRRWPHTYVTAAGDVVLRRVQGRYSV